jgi:hypothetical protein
MRKRIMPILGALLVILWQAAACQAIAKVVRDGKPSNQAVEAGGTRPSPHAQPDPPPSVTGALVSEEGWFTRCALWPWRMLGSMSFHPSREPRFMIHAIPPERRPPH